MEKNRLKPSSVEFLLSVFAATSFSSVSSDASASAVALTCCGPSFLKSCGVALSARLRILPSTCCTDMAGAAGRRCDPGMPRAEAKLLAMEDDRSRGGLRRGVALGGDCGVLRGDEGRAVEAAGGWDSVVWSV